MKDDMTSDMHTEFSMMYKVDRDLVVALKTLASIADHVYNTRETVCGDDIDMIESAALVRKVVSRWDRAYKEIYEEAE
jgi:hypothetical protein